MGKVYFIPRYIGALKYYEKLFPALRERGADPAFLLLEDGGMRAYSHARHLSHDARFLEIPLGKIPLVSHIVREKSIFGLFDRFLDEARPAVLVAEPRMGERERALFQKAATLKPEFRPTP